MDHKFKVQQMKHDIATLYRIKNLQERLKELGKKKVGFFGKAEVEEYRELKKFEKEFIN